VKGYHKFSRGFAEQRFNTPIHMGNYARKMIRIMRKNKLMEITAISKNNVWNKLIECNHEQVKVS